MKSSANYLTYLAPVNIYRHLWNRKVCYRL